MNTLWKALQWVPETTSDTRSYGIHAYVPCFLLSQFPVVKWYKIFWGFPILMGQLQLDPHKKTGWSWFIHSSIFMFTTPKNSKNPRNIDFPWVFRGFSMVLSFSKEFRPWRWSKTAWCCPPWPSARRRILGGRKNRCAWWCHGLFKWSMCYIYIYNI